MKEYMLGTSVFIELKPSMVVEDALELPPDIFPGLGVEGLYVIDNVFMSGGYPKQPAPENFWKGTLKTRPLTILVVKKAPNRRLEATGQLAR